LQLRLAVLEAAASLSDVPVDPPERRHQLTQNRAGQFAVDAMYPYRLIFEPDHDPIPRQVDGGIDLDQVTAIVIVEIVDYH
jgi:proteic killer suppression protein